MRLFAGATGISAPQPRPDPAQPEGHAGVARVWPFRRLYFPEGGGLGPRALRLIPRDRRRRRRILLKVSHLAHRPSQAFLGE